MAKGWRTGPHVQYFVFCDGGKLRPYKQKRPGAQNAYPRQHCRLSMKRRQERPSCHGAHYTEVIVPVKQWNVKGYSAISPVANGVFIDRTRHPWYNNPEFADVVELVDSLDLGSNARACRFESCHPHQNRSTPWGCFYFGLKGAGREPIQMRYGGVVNPPASLPLSSPLCTRGPYCGLSGRPVPT